MKILVVGGAGYLGGAITDLLLSGKHEFIIYDSLLYEEEYLKKVPFIKGDVREKDKLKKLLDWSDQVIWIAAIVGDKACLVNLKDTHEVNSQTVKWLSEVYEKRIIYTSTCSVYGEKQGTVDEAEEPNPISIYAETKLIAEKYLLDKNALIFRMGTLFGLSDTYSRIRLDLVINSLSAQAFFDKKIRVFGGNQYRPVLHVRDAAGIIVSGISQDEKGIYNISQENLSLDEIAAKVTKYLPGTKVKKEKLLNDFRTYKVSCEKAIRDLGISPKLRAEDGISEIVEMLKKGRIKDANNIRYYNHLALETLYNVKK